MLQEIGVPTLPKSRIAQYRRLFHEFAAAGHNPRGIGLAKATRLLHAIVEVDQLILIAMAAKVQPETWRKRLEPLISGPAFPLEGKDDSAARDHQYACFIAAAAQLGGCRINFQEPDVVISSRNLVVGLAAKRPRRDTTFLKNCRRAARQIRSYAGPGIVALDATTALFEDFCVNTNDPTGAVAAVSRKLWTFVEGRADRIRSECEDVPVIGVLVTAYAPALIYREAAPPTLYTTKVWSAVDIGNAGPTNRQWFAEFVKSAHAAAFRKQEMDA